MNTAELVWLFRWAIFISNISPQGGDTILLFFWQPAVDEQCLTRSYKYRPPTSSGVYLVQAQKPVAWPQARLFPAALLEVGEVSIGALYSSFSHPKLTTLAQNRGVTHERVGRRVRSSYISVQYKLLGVSMASHVYLILHTAVVAWPNEQAEYSVHPASKNDTTFASDDPKSDETKRGGELLEFRSS
ncbi:uncharacterized protein CIMG_13287 [Coccidioides immitis RS]|uniref:Uncharacterized protein n=1 Tax=Coccidioides immitis (strain RS) TaxID=246410 RepID=A0A0E1RV62_COCIM|nr:uncharacterized protein CIMG_13287 [Coccidioides immitis RS]EAS29154.1 hypothetical protein CIMG_13287 [Coccidioides immitis RS]